MALTLIATPGAANANSYCTIAEANAYHEAHLYAEAWTEGDDEKRIPALIWATRLLDEQMQWRGYPSTLEQALRWPRSWVPDRDGQVFIDNAIVPTFLKHAT